MTHGTLVADVSVAQPHLRVCKQTELLTRMRYHDRLCSVKFSCNANMMPSLHASKVSAAAWRMLQLHRSSMVLQDSKINALDLMHQTYTYSKHGKQIIA